MTIQIAHLTWDRKGYPESESREAYLDLGGAGFPDIKLLKEVLRNKDEWESKGITYPVVAKMEGDDLEKAFFYTNSIDTCWWENTAIKPVFEGEGCRSTSVGDLMFLDGKTYLVASCGFEEVVL